MNTTAAAIVESNGIGNAFTDLVLLLFDGTEVAEPAAAEQFPFDTFYFFAAFTAKFWFIEHLPQHRL